MLAFSMGGCPKYDPVLAAINVLIHANIIKRWPWPWLKGICASYGRQSRRPTLSQNREIYSEPLKFVSSHIALHMLSAITLAR